MIGVRIESNILGPRLFIAGHRWHHFHIGLAMLGAGAIGAYLIAKDLDDFLEWCIR